jgi:hypothetical protein
VLIAHHLPELGADLVAALPALDVQDLPHLRPTCKRRTDQHAKKIGGNPGLDSLPPEKNPPKRTEPTQKEPSKSREDSAIRGNSEIRDSNAALPRGRKQ